MLRNYIAVIWPTGYKYRDEIVCEYRSNPRVKCVSDFYEKEFPNADAFKEFIFDIYKNDDLSRDILEYKTGLMMKNDHFICSVFTFAAESDVDENIVDETVLAMKTNTRNIIAAKMTDYYYDILFHVTDVKREVDCMKTVLEKYEITAFR